MTAAPSAPFAIEGVLRRYAWGSPTVIPAMLGEEPDGRPAAELWFGAHAGDPSPAGDGTTLDALVAAGPEALLGAATVERFGPQLPFLLKILAAEQALSIQVHPNLEQARRGFAREEAAGIAADAPDRNYRDANHKPELICALTPFEAVCGFRPVPDTLAVLDALPEPARGELAFLAGLLRGPAPLRAAFPALLRHDDPARLAGAVAAVATPDGPLRPSWLAAQDFPGDIGIVVALLLNPVTLRPGEAIFLGAGNVHAYLRGAGVEIMANSDNVLRCGLTSKHIDVAELLEITDFTELADPRWSERDGRFSVPVPDFALVPLDGSGPVGVPPGRPGIVLAVAGEVSVGDVRLRPGRAAFVPAASGATVSGTGQAFLATTG